MADIEQEIKVKVKGVLEGFDALKRVKSDLKGISNEKVTVSGKGDIDALAAAIRSLPSEIAKANQESKGLVSTIGGLIDTGANVAHIVTGLISVFNFLGITGQQVKDKVTGAFNTIKGGISEATQTVKGFFTSLSSGAEGGGFLSSLTGGFKSLISSVGEAVPALAEAGAGIAAIGVTAGVVIAVVVALAAAIASVIAIAGGVALAGTVGTGALLAMASAGFEYNAQIEQIELGTGALIAQLGELRQNGMKLEGIDAVNAGIALGKQELAKLRVDAIQTTATFGELAEAFQAAVGSGLGAGLTLDQIRVLTVGLAQAGAALGVPYNQMRQEINSILEGTIDINSRIAKNLGISNEQVKNWKQQGTLAEELNKRLAGFTAAGIKSAQTLAGLKSNLQEALNVFTGAATTQAFERLKDRLSKILNSLFDFKSGGLNAALKPIADLIDKFLVKGIERFADWIDTAVEYAKKLGKFIDDNRKTIDEIIDLVDAITRNVVGMLGEMIGVSSTTDTWKNILGIVRDVLQFINGLMIAIRGVVFQAAQGFSVMANFITGSVIPALNQIMQYIPGIAQLVGLLSQLGNIGGGTVSASAGMGLDTSGLTVGGTKRTGGGKKGGGGANKAGQIAEAQAELTRTRQQNALNELLAGLKVEEAAVEDSYNRRGIATEAYFKQKGETAQREADAEIAKETKLLELANAKLARSKGAADKLRAQADVEEAQSRIAVLQTEAAEKQTENDREKRDALEALNQQYEDLRNTLRDFQGLNVEADVSRLNTKYREILERATADGNEEVIKLIENVKKYEGALIKLSANEKNYNNILAERDDKLAEIDELVTAGTIGELEASNRRIQLEREYKGELLDVLDAQIALAKAAEQYDKVISLTAARRKVAQSGDKTTPQLLAEEQAKFDRLKSALDIARNAVDNQVNAGQITPELGAVKRLQVERELRGELEKSLGVMRELAAATATLDDDIAVENLAGEIQNLGVQTDTLGKGITDALRSGLSGLFDSLIQGTQSVKQAFVGMVANILSQIARLAANELLRSLFSSGIFKSGGALGFLGGLKFADGGSIAGAGTSVSDSIPIMASHGEYMIRAAAVRKLGVPFLNYLNGGGDMRRLFGRFAQGGAITGGGSDRGAGETPNGGVRIINVIDPSLVKDYLGTSSGEGAILNVLKRNPQFIKQIIT